MKTLVLLVALSIGSACALEQAPASTSQYVFGISPFLERSVKDDVYRRLLAFILQDAPMNSTVAFYDAYNLQTIAQIEVPAAKAFRSSKTRANQFAPEIRKLKEFLARTAEAPVIQKTKLEQAVRLPQFLDFVGENIGGRKELVIAVIGSPLYLDVKEPSFSMIDGYFPSDAHLGAPREKTVFGKSEPRPGLGGAAVHLAHFGDPWLSELHKAKIARFWSLYAQQREAQLVTLTGDLASAFKAISEGPVAPTNYKLDRSQTKIEMLRVGREVEIVDWIRSENVPVVTQPPSKTVGPMKIGIRWRGDIDLDLYAQPRANGETLFFENLRIPEGYYFKDHRSSPEREYEFIEFESPVDVWQVQARINFYEGSLSDGPSGEVRIEFDGKIYSGEFKIAAPHGNEGRLGGNQRQFWTRIDVPKLLKLERLDAQRDSAP